MPWHTQCTGSFATPHRLCMQHASISSIHMQVRLLGMYALFAFYMRDALANAQVCAPSRRMQHKRTLTRVTKCMAADAHVAVMTCLAGVARRPHVDRSQALPAQWLTKRHVKSSPTATKEPTQHQLYIAPSFDGRHGAKVLLTSQMGLAVSTRVVESSWSAAYPWKHGHGPAA